MTWLGKDLPMELEISIFGTYEGRVANVGFMLGRRSLGWTSTTDQGDLCNYLDGSQDQANIPNTSTQYYLYSTSSQDGVGGTGIRSVLINYLAVDGTRTVASVNLNGTTPVAIPFFVSHVQYMESDSIGSIGTAVGDIYLSSRSTSGLPTVAQIIGKIDAKDGRSMDGVLKVPKGFSCYLLGWNVRSISQTMDCRLRATIYTHNHSLSPGWHFQQQAYLTNNSGYDENMHYMLFPEFSKIKISAIPGASQAGNRCDGSFKFCLVSNT
jgi:hypothetical protein